MLLAGRVVLGMVGGGPLSAPHQAPTVLVSDRVHVVQPGDTLWSIARSLQPEGDVRRLVQQLATQRKGSALQVGERIVLP
ncbi:MAG TPA: LysM domain-containing protein [Acidimicrobiales bacterium]|jgi:LysM repeat protein